MRFPIAAKAKPTEQEMQQSQRFVWIAAAVCKTAGPRQIAISYRIQRYGTCMHAEIPVQPSDLHAASAPRSSPSGNIRRSGPHPRHGGMTLLTLFPYSLLHARACAYYL